LSWIEEDVKRARGEKMALKGPTDEKKGEK
jgi:hypothetical protein